MDFKLPNLSDPKEMEKLIKMREAQAQKDLEDMLKNDPELQGLQDGSDEELNNLDKSGEVNSDDELEKQINAPDSDTVQHKKEEIDCYEAITESKLYCNKEMFHRVEAFFSMGVLEEEMKIMDTIIEFKKTRKEDYDIWEMKKGSIELKMNTIRNNVEMGILEFDDYKKDCVKQKNYEQQLIEKITKENKIKFIDEVLKRIRKRIDILDLEINQNQEDIQQEESKVDEPVKLIEQDKDTYEEKTENILHNADKFNSMGVLEDELKLMDKIIEIKKKNNIDFDCWELKKGKISLRMNTISNNVNMGILDIEEYKKDIQKQKDYEIAVIDKISKEAKINFKEENIKRLEKRIEIIEKELNANMDEEPQEHHQEEKKEVKDKEKIIIDIDNKSSTGTISTNKSTIQQNKHCGPDNVKDKKLYENLKERLEEYKQASEYFSKIMGNSNSAQDALGKASQLVKAIKQMEEGEEVDELVLPIQVTTDYICGCSQQERLNHFNIVIKEFSEKKNKLKIETQHYQDQMKSIDKKEFVKRKDEIKHKLDEYKSKIDKYTTMLNKLMELAKNPWVPAPLYSMVEEEEKKEVIIDDIPENTIKIYIGKTTYDKEKIYLQVNLQINDNKNHSEYIYYKSHMIYDQEITLKLEKNEFKRMGKKTLEITIFKNRWFWPFKPMLKGNVKIKLSQLDRVCEMSNDYDIALESKRLVPKLFVKMRVRTPFLEKEYKSISKTQFNVTKIYSSFKGDHAVSFDKTEEKNKSKPMSQAVSDGKKPEVVKEKKPEIAKTQEVKKETAPKTDVVYNVSEFTPEELENPDIVDNLNSIEVLTFKLNKLNNEVKKIEGRVPRTLRDPINKMTVKKQILTNQIEGGVFSPEDYLMIMKNQLEKDKKLQQYFMDKGDMAKKILVSERIPILVKEITEGINYLKKAKK